MHLFNFKMYVRYINRVDSIHKAMIKCMLAERGFSRVKVNLIDINQNGK